MNDPGNEPRKKPAGGVPDGDDKKERAREEEVRDDDEEFPDLFEENDPDFDDPDEQEIP